MFFVPFIKFLNLFGRHYKVRVGLLFLSSILAGLLEIVGVMLILPFMIMLRSPEDGAKLPILSDIYAFFHFSDPNQLTYFVAIMLGLIFAFKNIYMIAHRYVEFGFVMRWKDATRQRLMRHYLSLPYDMHLKQRSSSFVTSIHHDLDVTFQRCIMQYIILFSNMIIVLLILLLILYMFPVPALISGVMLVVLILAQLHFVRLFSNEIKSNITKIQAESLDIIQKAFFGIKETKTFLKERVFLNIFEENSKHVSHQERMFNFMNYTPPHVTEIIMISSIIIMACLILYLEGSDGASMQHLAILAVAGFRIAPTINRIAFCYGEIKSSLPVLEKMHGEIAEIFSKPPATFPVAEKLTFKTAITLENVSFSYQADADLSLKNINLTIPRGSFLGIIGPSGSGKTTLADVVMGLLHPLNGTLKLDDQVITPGNVRGYCANISYVSQHPFLYPGSLQRNIAFGVEEENIDAARIAEVLKQVELLDFFMQKPQQLNTPLGEFGKNLSGGQRQRIAIARALYIDADILVMDEATSALDVETEQHISDVINDLKGNKTIVSIAHRLSTLKKCDDIIYMENGEILSQGNYSELYQSSEKVRKIIDLTNLTYEQMSK